LNLNLGCLKQGAPWDSGPGHSAVPPPSANAVQYVRLSNAKIKSVIHLFNNIFSTPQVM